MKNTSSKNVKRKHIVNRMIIIMILVVLIFQIIWINNVFSSKNEIKIKVLNYPSWPVTWNWLDFDINESGSENMRDVNSTYFNIVDNYLFLRMTCYDKHNFSQYPDVRYKWFIDLDNNIYRSGNNIIDGEYLIFLEDTDNDGNGEIYILYDNNDSNNFNEYEPPNTYEPFKISNQSIADFRILDNNIDVYVNLNIINNSFSMWCAWATDNENINLDQAPSLDSTDLNDLPLGPLKNVNPIISAKNDNKDPAIAGTNFTYNIWVNNTQNILLKNINLTELLDENLILIHSNPLPTINNNIWHFNLSSFESWKLTLVVHIPSNIISDKELRSTSIIIFDQIYEIEISETTDVISISNMSIEIIDNPDPVSAGKNLKYTINISNIGPSDLTNFSIINILPDKILLISANPIPDIINSSNLTWYFNEIVVGDSFNILLDTKIPASITKNKLINQIQIISNNSVISEKSEQTNVIINNPDPEKPDDIILSIKKQADHQIIQPGGILIYTVTVQNDGSNDATNLRIKDDYDENLLKIIEISAGGNEENGKIVWDKININSKSQKQFQIKTQVRNNISEGTLIVNKAMVKDLAATTSTYVEFPQQFNIALDVSSNIIEYGQTLRYSMFITNLFEKKCDTYLVFQYDNQSFEIINISNNGFKEDNNIIWNNLSIAGKSTLEVYVDVRLKYVNQTNEILWGSMEINGIKKSISVNVNKNQLIYPIDFNNSIVEINSQKNNSFDKQIYQITSLFIPTFPIIFIILLYLFSSPHIVIDDFNPKFINKPKQTVYIAEGEKIQKNQSIKIRMILPNRQIYKYLHEIKNIKLSSAKAIAIYLEYGGKLILNDKKAYEYANQQGYNVELSNHVPQNAFNK